MTKATLKAGDPACSDDMWFRPLTNKRHLRGDGSLNHAAFKGRAISPPANTHSCWQHELSGRLASLAGTEDAIRQDGENRAGQIRRKAIDKGQSGKDFVFAGVMYRDVDHIRKLNFTRADVIYDPTMGDKAHANIVFFDNIVEVDGGVSILDDLTSSFLVLRPEKLSALLE